jgi:hypothetical protein
MISLATRLVSLRLTLLAYAELVKEAERNNETVGAHLRRILEAHFMHIQRLRK